MEALLVTHHGKEEALTAPFATHLGLTLVPAELDTDRFGTFSGEIERIGTPLECAEQKCRAGLDLGTHRVALASEGSFIPHPALPFMQADSELLLYVDTTSGIRLHESLLSTETNHAAITLEREEDLAPFLERALFPSHGLIAKYGASIEKGIQCGERLSLIIEEAKRRNLPLTLETDMRAHMNPTRMRTIAELGERLACRLATYCPSCGTPGWGRIATEAGLPCESCHFPTPRVRAELFGCCLCPYTELHPRSDGVAEAQADCCPICNP